MTQAAAEPLLSVTGLTKRYCRDTQRALRYAAADVVRELMPRRGPVPLRRGEFLALDDVGFALHPGEALAVLGPNGAGKSSLLKIVLGLLKPSAGEVRTRGTTGAIIELGTGLSPTLSGRENILLGAALAGRSGAETRRLLDEVVDFAELDDAIDAPVQSYSSGMRARLAYAIATHPRPDILLVDEAIAVGDIQFQRKCVRHMRSHLDQGGCLLFVSHNVFQIQAVCARGLLLDQGRIVFHGEISEALNRMLQTRRRPAPAAAAPDPTGPVTITALTVEPVDAAPVRPGSAVRIRLGYRATERQQATWGFSIWTADLWTCVTGDHDMRPVTLEAGEGELSCLVPSLPLMPGDYAVRAALMDTASWPPLARWGWDNEPQPLRVLGTGSVLQNAQVAANQLVTIAVEWP